MRLDNALTLVVKHVVSNSLDSNERLDKLKEVLTKDVDEDENIDALIEELITVQS